MRLIFSISLFLGLIIPGNIFAARLHHAPIIRHHQQQQPAQTQQEIRELDNKFFSITLPDGWKMDKPVRAVADRVSADFKKGNNIRIALNIFSVPFTNKLIAEKTAENMRKRGMTVSEPQEKDGFYVIDIEKNGITGKGWFGSDGKTGASTIIFAPELTEANEILEALKLKIPGLVPQKVN